MAHLWSRGQHVVQVRRLDESRRTLPDGDSFEVLCAALDLRTLGIA